MKSLLISLLLLFVSSSVFAGGSEVEGMKKAEQVCQSCHGMDGQGLDETYPVLAGQFADYMVKALEDYKSGERKNAIMAGFAASLSKQDMENVAGFIIEALDARDDQAKLANIGVEVAKFSSRFPVPGLDG